MAPVAGVTAQGAAELMRETPGPKVLLGDLNVTPWSPYFQDLVEGSGLRDVRVGSGLWTTWPMPLPSFLRIPIDHCLTSDDVAVREFTTVGGTGSDHRAILVDVSVPRAAVAAILPLLGGPGAPAVVAVDIPSGIDADDGAVPDPVVLPADVTVTFGGIKAGLLLPPARDLAGEIVLVDIGIGDELGKLEPLLRLPD